MKKLIFEFNSMQTKTVSQLNNYYDVLELADVVNLLNQYQIDRDDLLLVTQRIRNVRSNVLVSALVSQLINSFGGNLQFYTKALLSEEQIDQGCDKLLTILDQSYWAKLVDVLQIKNIFDYRVTSLIFGFGQPEQSFNQALTKKHGFISAEFSADKIEAFISYIEKVFSPQSIKLRFESMREIITHQILDNGDIRIHLKPKTPTTSDEGDFVFWAYTLIRQYHPNDWLEIISNGSSDLNGVLSFPGISLGSSNVAGVCQQTRWIQLDAQFKYLLENILGEKFTSP